MQKIAQAVNLDELKRQKEKVDQYVVQMEKQLPGKAEMAALLSDINNAGTGRGLSFELFKPSRVDVKEYYAEQPIELRINGSYHDLGAFAGDLAGMTYPRDRALWLGVDLTIRGTVSGSEAVYIAYIPSLPGASTDYSDGKASPPGLTSPYGSANTFSAADCLNPN